MCVLAAVLAGPGMAQERIQTQNGMLEGTYDQNSGITSFKGIPFAARPVGDLRWKPPQPVESWKGVRPAKSFGPRAMQLPLYDDMKFRSAGMSEDCLYLNVWTLATSGKQKLPVLVYFYGGGFQAGDGSELRYDGESMAKKGIVAVTVNYRLGIFGFFCHPALVKESPHQAAGNYALLDQHAAIKWVHENIAAFGGDPGRVTIAGESAGSFSVSAQMASPLSKGLFSGAIGESGSILGGHWPAMPLAEAEEEGVKLASRFGIGSTPSLAALRQIPADDLLQAANKAGGSSRNLTLDGYFLTSDPAQIFASGRQTQVPLLAGVNSEEGGYGSILGAAEPTVENYRQALQRLFPGKADEVFNLYPATNEEEVKDAAQALASDRFLSYSTWKWVDLATRSGGCPTYYYLFSHPRPPVRPEPGSADAVTTNSQLKTNLPSQSRGATHSAEIEYALGNLNLNKAHAWTSDDYKISEVMQDYFANFIKTADPNGPGLPVWPKFASGERMIIDETSRPEFVDQLRARYKFFDKLGELKK